MSFMDDIKKEMEATRDEATEKLDKARAEGGEDENGVVVSDGPGNRCRSRPYGSPRFHPAGR
jgi:hypothetical protein